MVERVSPDFTSYISFFALSFVIWSAASATEVIKTDVHVIKKDVNGIQTNVVELTDRVANLEKDESNLTEIDSNANIFTIHDNLWNDILSEVTEKTSE